MVVVALALFPPLSVTDAVSTCAPGWSVPPSSVPPPPSGPWRLDVQPIAVERSPSSASAALAVTVTGSSGANVGPLDGTAIGNVGSALTTTLTVPSALLPPPSVPAGLIVCGPQPGVHP